jgi:hypothetical protein
MKKTKSNVRSQIIQRRPFHSSEPPRESIRVGQNWLEGEDYIAGAMPVRQRLHNLAQTHGILRGTGVNVSAPYGGDQARTIAESV